MKRGDIVEGFVESVDYPDVGTVVTSEGAHIRVKNVIKGQRVAVRVKKSGVNKKGSLFKVLERSVLEDAISPCRLSGICGGCAYQTVSYKNQILLKQGQIEKLFADVMPEGFAWGSVLSPPDVFSYRNKMEFTFGDSSVGGPLTLGMHARNSFYDIYNADCCNIAHSDFTDILAAVLEYFKKKNIPHYHKVKNTGILRYLIIRKSSTTGRIMILFVTTTGYTPDDDFPSMLKGLHLEGRIFGILHGINDSVADTSIAQRVNILYGTDRITERLFDLNFEISPYSFFQTNTAGAMMLYDLVQRMAVSAAKGSAYEDNHIIFDLYCGTGTITQILAKSAAHVTGVEINGESVMAAKKNAAANGLSNCSFICSDVLEALDGLDRLERPQTIVLDPPREGVHPRALVHITDVYAPENIIYISCKATSLARDIKIMREHGYTPVSGKIIDLFPQTVHVETVVLLSRTSK